jgi:shikimate dehydrogenase
MRRFGLIGKTLGHSFSKNYFFKKFEELHITDCSYENFELQSVDLFPRLLQDTPYLAGLNVTIPYKEAILPFLHQQTDEVASIGACNCIRVEGERLIAFNTDWIGFSRSLEPFMESHHNQALILGSGGAAKAVQYALSQLGIEWKVVSRRNGQLAYAELDKMVMQEHTLIINTTPLGMYPNTNEAPVIPYEFIGKEHLLFDLIYNPAETLFLQKGKAQGATVLNGERMLVIQAEESWRIWNQA